jgi:hypothetical protein
MEGETAYGWPKARYIAAGVASRQAQLVEPVTVLHGRCIVSKVLSLVGKREFSRLYSVYCTWWSDMDGRHRVTLLSFLFIFFFSFPIFFFRS